jgi:peptidoglycan/LPS O-acetylase OafA/YrhL
MFDVKYFYQICIKYNEIITYCEEIILNTLKSSQAEREFIYIWKAIALLSIISAHVAATSENASAVELFCSRLISSWGSYGVPAFFIASGYLYERTLQNHDIKYILQNKFKGLIIPWLFCGTLVWLYVVLRKGNITVSSWLNFVSGNNSYLYYMTITIVIYVMYIFLRKKDLYIYLGICMWLFNNIFAFALRLETSFSIYLNVFVWLGWFLIGALIQKKNLQNYIQVFAGSKWTLLALSGICYVLYICFFGSEMSYWHKFYLPVEALSLLVMLFLTYTVKSCLKNNTLLVNIGRDSFSLYLLHMPIAGITANIMSRFSTGILMLLRPFIVLAVTYFLLWIADIIARHIRLERLFHIVIGKR